MRPLVHSCEERGIGVAIVPRLFDDVTNRMVLEHVGGLPVFELRRGSTPGWQFALKHGFDRVVTALLLLVLSPLLAVIGLAVLVSSGVPVLYPTGAGGLGRQDLQPVQVPLYARALRRVGVGFPIGDSAPGGGEGADRPHSGRSFAPRHLA